jgi:hypothetical protein
MHARSARVQRLHVGPVLGDGDADLERAPPDMNAGAP